MFLSFFSFFHFFRGHVVEGKRALWVAVQRACIVSALSVSRADSLSRLVRRAHTKKGTPANHRRTGDRHSRRGSLLIRQAGIVSFCIFFRYGKIPLLFCWLLPPVGYIASLLTGSASFFSLALPSDARTAKERTRTHKDDRTKKNTKPQNQSPSFDHKRVFFPL